MPSVGLGPFDLTVKQSLAVIGPNGSGKTLFLKALIGLVASQGRVSFNHYLLNHRSLKGQLLVGFLASPPDLEETLTGWRQLDLIGSFYRLSATARRERILTLAKQFNCQDDLFSSFGSLGAASCQRIGLVAAWLGEPRLLALDQPTNFLDHSSREKLIELLEIHHAQGGVSVITTNDLAFAETTAKQFLFMADGQTRAQGSLTELANLLRAGKNLENIYHRLYDGQF